MKLNTRLAAYISLVLLIITSILLLTVRQYLRNYAIEVAEEKARLVLSNKQATINYINKDLRPPLFKLLKEKQISDEYFDPHWMSAAYINRKIMEYFTEHDFSEYYYKSAAINARTPLNEADQFEKQFLINLKSNPLQTLKKEVIDIDGKQFFILMKKNNTVFNEGCMKCHSEPEIAPADMLKVYGDIRSFHKDLGATASVLSVRIPIDKVYQNINHLTIKLLIAILVFALIVFIFQVALTNRFIVSPLKRFQRKIESILSNETYKDEKIGDEFKAEFQDLAYAFQSMMEKLEDHQNNLNNQIAERTSELETSRTEYKNLFECMQEGFSLHKMVFDTEGNPQNYTFLKVNPAFEKLTGLKKENIIGKTVLDVMPGTEEFWLHAYGEVVKTGHPARIKHFSAEIGKHFEVYAYKTMDQHFAVIFNDVTEHVLAEEKKKEFQEHLKQSQKMEALGTLAGGIAHDFNNILGVILGYSEMLKDELPANSSSMEFNEKVLQATSRAKDLAHQILSFSRREGSKKDYFLPQPIIKEVMKMLRSSLPATIELKHNICNDTGSLLGDATQLHQILMNLCTNAYHAMKGQAGELKVNLISNANPPIPVNARESKQYYELTVSDNGHGIDPAIQEKIFEPFFTTKSEGEGTGLGLSVIYGIIQEFKGTITLDSTPGKGTSFHIFLPMYSEEQAPQETLDISTSVGKENILLVDDESLLTDLGTTTLSSAGYKVEPFNDPVEALNRYQLAPEDFDLIISDQTMPNMTGIELAKEIRKINTHIPIIICTGFRGTIESQEVKQTGISNIIDKPYSKTTLLNAIHSALKD